MTATGPVLELAGITKRFGAVEVLHGIDLTVAPGEFVIFVGPSGCGKSTLLRIIAGLDDATAGQVRIAGRAVNALPPAQRGIAMVFQTYALYPHLTVKGNMELGLRQAGEPRDRIAARVAETSTMLELGPLLDRRPAELSGGQRQRVAIGRAMVREPTLFLFDEPCRTSTRRCGSRPGWKSRGCTANWTPPWSTSPTTRWRR
jgi:multiple sugar transport system ATP-binding protein